MSRKRKYSDKLRFQIVQEYLSGKNGGFSSLSRKYGISSSNIKLWVRIYENGGLDALMNVSGSYDGAFKVHVVEYMHQNSSSLSYTIAKFGIRSVSTLLKWERLYYEEGKEALLEERRGRATKMTTAKKERPPQGDVNKNEDLLAEVQRLRMENEYLKKLIALTQEREKQEQKTK